MLIVKYVKFMVMVNESWFCNLCGIIDTTVTIINFTHISIPCRRPKVVDKICEKLSRQEPVE